MNVTRKEQAICAETVPGWQPIATAPKDIEMFLILYCPEDNSRWWASWQGLRWYGCDDFGLTREGYSFGDPDVVTGWAITHWMPLPAPPKMLTYQPEGV